MPKAIIKCWVQVAQIAKLAFEKNYTEEKYSNLKWCLETEVAILTKVINVGSNIVILWA